MAKRQQKARERKVQAKPRSRGKHQRINITLPDEIHTLAKVIAVAKGVNLGEFFNDAIESAISEEDELLNITLTELGGAR